MPISNPSPLANAAMVIKPGLTISRSILLILLTLTEVIPESSSLSQMKMLTDVFQVFGQHSNVKRSFRIFVKIDCF